MKRNADTIERPRLVVYRSNRQLEAQALSNDGSVLLGVKTKGLSKKSTAHEFGLTFAAQCQTKQIAQLVFDRRQYTYTGRIKAFIEGVREGGIQI